MLNGRRVPNNTPDRAGRPPPRRGGPSLCVPTGWACEVFAEFAGLSHRAVAKTLNERGIKTAAGKSWPPVQVTRVRERLGLIDR